ncbi:MAG: hypothetical protein ACYCY3_07485 [Halothiobacillus sp.]
MQNTHQPPLSLTEAKIRFRQVGQPLNPTTIMGNTVRAHPLISLSAAMLGGALAQRAMPIFYRTVQKHPELFILLTRAALRLR